MAIQETIQVGIRILIWTNVRTPYYNLLIAFGIWVRVWVQVQVQVQVQILVQIQVRVQILVRVQVWVRVWVPQCK